MKTRNRLQKPVAPKVSLLDVAAEAGCSSASVSRVLNQPETVKEELRARVQAAMDRLGYRPNSAARALRSRHSHIMGIVIPTLDYAIYARLVEGLQGKLTEHGYSLVVATSGYDLRREAEQAKVLIERGIEGLALVGGKHRDELHGLLDRAGIPYVNTYVYGEKVHPCVGFDNRRATEDVTEFLLDLGHRTFGAISARAEGNDRAAARLAGVRVALERHGLRLAEEAVYEGEYSVVTGRDGLRYLRALATPPTAVICGNDVLAMGALLECQALGVGVPEQVSIVGFDNLEFARHLQPPLTTVEVPATEMGQRAAEFLVRRVKGDQRAESVYVEPRLIARRTTSLAPIHLLGASEAS